MMNDRKGQRSTVDITKRIADLSPEKRKLVEKRLRQGRSAGESPSRNPLPSSAWGAGFQAVPIILKNSGGC